MKTLKLFMAVALSLSAMAITSCSSDDDDIPVSSVPTAVTENFAKMYPNAKNVDWDKTAQWYVAEFSYNTFGTDAWYAHDGAWAMTETDYGMSTAFLPELVQQAFSESQYASWVLDDVEIYDRPVNSFCAIEVENPVNGNDVIVFYDTYGNLLKIADYDIFDITPNTVVENL